MLRSHSTILEIYSVRQVFNWYCIEAIGLMAWHEQGCNDGEILGVKHTLAILRNALSAVISGTIHIGFFHGDVVFCHPRYV
jgi:uncharacterized membrane protein YeiH